MKRLHVVMGMVRDKDYETCVHEVASARMTFTPVCRMRGSVRWMYTRLQSWRGSRASACTSVNPLSMPLSLRWSMRR